MRFFKSRGKKWEWLKPEYKSNWTDSLIVDVVNIKQVSFFVLFCFSIRVTNL